jgi:hypothetical protein
MRVLSPHLTLAAVALWSGATFSQTPPKPESDIVERLLLHFDPATVADLKPAERAAAVKELEAAETQATGKRAREIAFLLAALGSNYSLNRDDLISICAPVPTTACDEDTAALLIALYQSGHFEVLQPLLAMGPRSDAALAEALGEFYGDLLTKRPLEFLAAIRSMPPGVQNDLCELAGGEDGSGMTPNDFKQVRQELRHIGDGVALRCLQHIEIMNAR